MGFSRQEQWSVSPFLPPRDLLDPEIQPAFPALEADSLPLSHPAKHPKLSHNFFSQQTHKYHENQRIYIYIYICMMVIGIYIWSLYDRYFSHMLEKIQIFLELIKSCTTSTAWVKELEYSLWRNLATKVQQGSKAQVFWSLISLHGLASCQGSQRTCSVYLPSRKSTWSGHCSLSL